jgi:hypothetical protein
MESLKLLSKKSHPIHSYQVSKFSFSKTSNRYLFDIQTVICRFLNISVFLYSLAKMIVS